jgi:hypothetical protein
LTPLITTSTAGGVRDEGAARRRGRAARGGAVRGRTVRVTSIRIVMARRRMIV